MKRQTLLLALLLVGASFLLFYRLGERSLWEDEATTLFKLRAGIQPLLHYQKNLIYNFLLFSWVRMGTGEFWLRSLSVFFALLSVFTLYELGRRFFSRSIALLAALLFSTSVYFVFLSRQVRPFGLVLFFSIISLYSLMAYLETNRTRYLVMFIGASLFSFRGEEEK